MADPSKRHTAAAGDPWRQRAFRHLADYNTTAAQRRIIHFWLTILWLGPGTVIWLLLHDALWFVGFMSLYAIWVTHLAGWSAETPAEIEEEPPTEG